MKIALVVALMWAAACAPHRNGDDDGDTGGSGSGSAAPTCPSCTGDGTEVLECDGTMTECTSTQSCSQGACLDSCSAATDNHESVGCGYYSIDMDGTGGTGGGCDTVFGANTSRAAAHVAVEWNGQL